MGQINWGRVIGGGLLAGLIINIGEFILNEPLLGEQWREALKAYNMEPFGTNALAVFVVMGFVLGILGVWLYAAIRPRYGAGPKTAVCAGLAVWAFSYAYPSVFMLAGGFLPTNLILISLVWGLFEAPIALLVGAWAYKE
jgi:hypothetical protein